MELEYFIECLHLHVPKNNIYGKSLFLNSIKQLMPNLTHFWWTLCHICDNWLTARVTHYSLKTNNSSKYAITSSITKQAFLLSTIICKKIHMSTNVSKDTHMTFEIISKSSSYKFIGFFLPSEAIESQSFHGQSFCNNKNSSSLKNEDLNGIV